MSIIDVFHDAAARPAGDEYRPNQQRIGRKKRSMSALPHSGSIRVFGWASAVVGLVLGARVAEPGMLSTLGTLELLGVVILVLGPIMTLLALRFDRRCSAQRETAPSSSPRCTRSTMHEAHARSIPTPPTAAEPITQVLVPEHAA